MNMCNIHGVLHAFFDELLSFIASDLLPWANCLPCTMYETKQLVMKMELKHEQIHCCLEGHILYEGRVATSGTIQNTNIRCQVERSLLWKITGILAAASNDLRVGNH